MMDTHEPPTLTPVVQVLGLWQGGFTQRMLRVATNLDVFNRLLDGPRTSAELACETGTHERSLHRLLRSIAGLGLLRSTPRGWALTPLGVAAATLAPMLPWAEAALVELERAVRTGEPAMTFTHGCTAFEYLEQHPDDAADFDRIMALINTGEPQAVAEAYDFAGIERIADVGGGNGALLAAVLAHHPALHGVLFDLPGTVAHQMPALGAFGDRCEVAAGDFFEAVPAGQDAYLLSHVVHDWPEAQALAILARVREAIPPSGRLLVVENVMPGDDTPHPARYVDITMLLVTGGEERTEEEYAGLLARAGFRLERVIPTHSPVSVLEAVPV